MRNRPILNKQQVLACDRKCSAVIIYQQINNIGIIKTNKGKSLSWIRHVTCNIYEFGFKPKVGIA